MKIDVYDSYAQSKTGLTLHFDVFVESGTSKDTAFEYGRKWLAEIGESPEALNQSRCNYCHSRAAQPHWESAINETGYFILQMENCPNPIS